MGQLTLPPNLNNKNSSDMSSIPKPSPKEESRFSINEKIKLFVIIIIAITVPVFGTFIFTRSSYRNEMEQYKTTSNKQITELKNQINLLSNPAVKQLDQLENIVKMKKMQYFKEREEIEKDPVYQALIKKTKELDNQIIICNVHLQNIEIVKQNNYKDVELLIEKLNKEKY
jgi:hypothetical protein